MKLFLSFSKELAKMLAETTKKFIEKVLPNVESFTSSVDIISGEQWQHRMNDELSGCSYGLLILTRDNQSSEWIHFEAGALSKGDLSNRIIPICFGFTIEELESPIKLLFQGFTFNRTKMDPLIHQINSESENPIKDATISDYISKFWDEYEAEIGKNIEEYGVGEEEEDPSMKIIREVKTNRDSIRSILKTINSRTIEIRLKKIPKESLEKLRQLAVNYTNYYFYRNLDQNDNATIEREEYFEDFLASLYDFIKMYNLLEGSSLNQQFTLNNIQRKINASRKKRADEKKKSVRLNFEPLRVDGVDIPDVFIDEIRATEFGPAGFLKDVLELTSQEKLYSSKNNDTTEITPEFINHLITKETFQCGCNTYSSELLLGIAFKLGKIEEGGYFRIYQPSIDGAPLLGEFQQREGDKAIEFIIAPRT